MYYVLALLLSLCSTKPINCNDIPEIAPYNYERDHTAVETCITDSYDDIVCNSAFDHDRKTLKRRQTYAQNAAKNHTLKIFSHCKAMVIRYQNETAGYVVYYVPEHFVPWCNPCKGRISELGILPKYRGKNLGKMLCEHAIEDMKKTYPTIKFISVVTTTEEVGKKFYVPKLGFKYYDECSAWPIHSCTTYFWQKRFEPSMPEKIKTYLLHLLIRRK